MMQRILAALALIALSGCARVQFQAAPSGDALTYYEPTPYLLMQLGSDCTTETKVISVPGRARGLKLQPGYGSSNLTVALNGDGVLTNVGQSTDTKIPETITALTGAAKLFAPATKGLTATKPSKTCTPHAALYPIVGGRVDTSNPVNLTLK